MHKIDGDRAVNGQFVPEDPGAGLPPTQLTPDWCNDVQRELTDLIEHQDGGAAPLQKGVAQIRAAVAAMIGRAIDAINQALNGKASRNGDTFEGEINVPRTVYIRQVGGTGQSVSLAFVDGDGQLRFVPFFNDAHDGINGTGSGRGHVTFNWHNADGTYRDWLMHFNDDGVPYYNKAPRFGADFANCTLISNANMGAIPPASGVYILNAFNVTANNQVIGAPAEMIAAGHADIICCKRSGFGQRYEDEIFRISVTSHALPTPTGGIWRRISEWNSANSTWSVTPWQRLDGPAVIGAGIAAIPLHGLGAIAGFKYSYGTEGFTSTPLSGEVFAGNELTFGAYSGNVYTEQNPPGSWMLVMPGVATSTFGSTVTATGLFKRID